MEVCAGQRESGMEVEAVSGQATDMPSSLTATRRSNASDRSLLAKHAPGPVTQRLGDVGLASHQTMKSRKGIENRRSLHETVM